MTYTSGFDRDIFISYCHTDNENPLGLGWIEVFHNLLLIRLRQILGSRAPEEEPSIWRDARLQGNDEFSAVLEDELQRVALVISILSPSYVRSEWCNREVREFCQAAEARGGLAIDNKARIFKVLKTPVAREQHPPALQSQIGYEFFTVDRQTMIPREFTLMPGDANGARALEVINDLAYHVKATLDAVNAALGAACQDVGIAAPLPAVPAPAAAATATPRRSVYLAETSFELDGERSQVRRDLEARGVRVLPEGDLPVRHPAQFRAAVADALAQCDVSVHLVAPNRSLVLPGETEDTVYLQNEIAASLCEASGASRGEAPAASSRDASPLTRLIWIPQGGATVDPQSPQGRFIARLRDDPAAQKNAEVLTTEVQGLIARIHDTLRRLDEPVRRAAAPAARARPAVYVVAHPADRELAEPLREHLFDAGCEVLDPLSDPAASEKEIFETHKMNLVDGDAVVVCFGQASEFWLRSQLSDVQRAAGWREGRPLAARAVYVGPPDSAPKARLRFHDCLVLDGRGGFAATQVEPLLQVLRATVPGG